MALTLVSSFSMRVVVIDAAFVLSVSILALLVAVVLVIDTIGTRRIIVIFHISFPRLDGDNSSCEEHRFEHFKFV